MFKDNENIIKAITKNNIEVIVLNKFILPNTIPKLISGNILIIVEKIIVIPKNANRMYLI